LYKKTIEKQLKNEDQHITICKVWQDIFYSNFIHKQLQKCHLIFMLFLVFKDVGQDEKNQIYFTQLQKYLKTRKM